VIDYKSLGASVKDFAGINNAQMLQCQASTIVRPKPYPVRYYLDRTGKIFTIHGHGLNGSDTNANGWVFPSVYGQTNAIQNSGIISFAVHPRNLSLYVLRPGSLIRYSNCGGVPPDCSTASAATGGISDAGVTPWPTVQEFSVLSSIAAIGIDFRSGAVYGMTADRTSILSITLDNAGAPGNPLNTCSTCQPGSPPVLNYQTVAAGTFPMPTALGGAKGFRLSSFFLDPEGDTAYISDLTTTLMFGSGYSSNVYSYLDGTLQSPILNLPVGAVSFSK
jgi:hypothetical protein